MTRQHTLKLILAAVMIQGMSGCAEKSVSKAIPREGTAEVVTSSTVSQPTNSNVTAPLYSHLDHFAVVQINVARIIQQPQMQEVDWQQIVEPVLQPLGEVIQSVDEIQQITLLFDQEFFSLMSSVGVGDGNPLVTVIEAKQSLDMDKLGEDFVASEEQPELFLDSELKRGLWFADNQTIVIGYPKAVQKLVDNSQGNHELFDSKRLESGAGVSGNLIFSPVRPTLKSVLGPMAGFSEQIGDFVKMLDSLDRVDFSFDLANVQMGQGSFYLADESAAKNFKLQIDQAMQGIASLLGQSNGFQGQLDDVLLKPAVSSELWPKVIKQMVEGGTRITQSGNSVAVNITRPDSFDELLQAMAVDAKNQTEVGIRLANLDKVGQAMLQFKEEHGYFPAAHWKKDEDSQPFAWRVALLPYLEQQELFDQFKFDEPWDSEHNMSIAKDIPDFFQTAVDGKTTLHVIGGPSGAFSGEKHVKAEDIPDDHNKTVLIVEGGDSTAVNWHEPSLLEFDKDEEPPELGRKDENGIVVVLVDGSINAVSRRSETGIRAALSANGKDRVGKSAFMFPQLEEQ